MRVTLLIIMMVFVSNTIIASTHQWNGYNDKVIELTREFIETNDSNKLLAINNLVEDEIDRTEYIKHHIKCEQLNKHLRQLINIQQVIYNHDSYMVEHLILMNERDRDLYDEIEVGKRDRIWMIVLKRDME